MTPMAGYVAEPAACVTDSKHNSTGLKQELGGAEEGPESPRKRRKAAGRGSGEREEEGTRPRARTEDAVPDILAMLASVATQQSSAAAAP